MQNDIILSFACLLLLILGLKFDVAWNEMNGVQWNHVEYSQITWRDEEFGREFSKWGKANT